MGRGSMRWGANEMGASGMNLLLPPIFVREFCENNPICAIEFFMSAIKLRKLQRMKNKKCMNMQQIVLIYCISYHFQLAYISWCHLSLSVVFNTYFVLGKWTYSWYCPHTKSTKRWTVLSTVDLLTLKMSAMSRYIPPVAMNFKPICTCTNKARQY